MIERRHQELAAGRWWTMSLAEQLGNIGSEFSRAVRWRARQPDVSQAALYRALELFDLTLADARHRQPAGRLREIARAREVVVDFLDGSNDYRSSAASLQKYFDAFAIAARRAHGTGDPGKR
jgi:hypothetical protein